MIINLTPEQALFLFRAQARLNESKSVAAREQQAINDFCNTHPFVSGHGATMREAQARATAQEEVIADYCAFLGHPGAKVDEQNGVPVLVVEGE